MHSVFSVVPSSLFVIEPDRCRGGGVADSTHPVGAEAFRECVRHCSAGGELEVVALRPAWGWGPGDTTMLPALCDEDRRGRVWVMWLLIPKTFIKLMIIEF